MAQYKTPGVYIEEINTFPPSIAAVETAIPAFFGFTEKITDAQGEELVKVPTRITSLLEFEEIFGKSKVQEILVKVTQKKQNFVPKKVLETVIEFDPVPPTQPDYFLHYSMQLYFANGGGPCYIVSIGAYETAFTTALFTNAITEADKIDEPTLYVFPDACLAGDSTKVGTIINASLKSCAKLQDRFTICDVYKGIKNANDTVADVDTNFRGKISSDALEVKYGACYFPYIKTSINLFSNDDNIKVKSHSVIKISEDGTEAAPSQGAIPANTAISHDKVKIDETAAYNEIINLISSYALVTVPASGAIAGIYAKVDASRGVWKSPANTSMKLVTGPAVQITNDINDGLNVDANTGKSVNALRSFAGKGTMVWGARTLAGNSNEWRYVSVRRFFNFVEESVKKGTEHFVFEPNDANTWINVQSMIENFLILQWRDGALAGAKPEHAFYVNVGLNKTMSAQDILNGYLIIEIGMAVVRPAEFIVLKFMHKLQES